MKRNKVIFDCDIGCDDAVALIALLTCKDIDLQAVTCVHGNLPVEDCVNNALKVIELCGKDVPVYKGCAGPMVRDLCKGRDYNTLMQNVEKKIDGEEILIHEKSFRLPSPKNKVQDTHACTYLIETLKNSEEKIDICAVGPLTNIAMAIRLEPQIVDKIGTICIMGGGLYLGNRTPVAEANFYADPEAAQIVISSGAKCLICPIEPCQEAATYTLDDIATIASLDTPIAAFLDQELRDYIARCHVLFDGDPNSCCAFDYAAIAQLIDPNVITEKRKDIVNIDIAGGMSDGQMVVDRRGMFVNDSNVEVIYHMDEKLLHSILLDQLKKA